MPFVKLIYVFEFDEPLLPHAQSEWQLLYESIDLYGSNFDFKLKVLDLIDNRFDFAIANLSKSIAILKCKCIFKVLYLLNIF